MDYEYDAKFSVMGKKRENYRRDVYPPMETVGLRVFIIVCSQAIIGCGFKTVEEHARMR